MTDERRGAYSSPLDDMLVQARQQFDSLLDAEAAVEAPPSQSAEALGAPARMTRPDLAPLPGAEDAIRMLQQKHVNNWRYNVVERRHDGSSVTVLVELFVADMTDPVSAYGHAPGKSSSGIVRGTSDGVSFSIAMGRPSRATNLDAAYDRAIADALTNCVALL